MQQIATLKPVKMENVHHLPYHPQATFHIINNNDKIPPTAPIV